jgi:hypothetical protein
MTKRLIASFLLPLLFIYLTGCYSMYEFPKEDLNKQVQDSDLHVMTNDGKSFLFRAYTFHIKYDTLYGNLVNKLNQNQTPTEIKIPLKDISTWKTEKINVVNTTILILVFVVVIAAIAGASSLNNLGSGLGGL